ncbi:MAG: hypothetical protein ABEJ73_03790 [Haloplanus sp.]
MNSRAPPRGLSVYGLLAVGVVTLWSVSLPSGSLFREVTPTDLVMGVSPLDPPSLAVGGGLFLVGLAAITLGLSLLFARVA